MACIRINVRSKVEGVGEGRANNRRHVPAKPKIQQKHQRRAGARRCADARGSRLYSASDRVYNEHPRSSESRAYQRSDRSLARKRRVDAAFASQRTVASGRTSTFPKINRRHASRAASFAVRGYTVSSPARFRAFPAFRLALRVPRCVSGPVLARRRRRRERRAAAGDKAPGVRVRPMKAAGRGRAPRVQGLADDIMHAQLKARRAAGEATLLVAVDRAFHAKALLAVANAELHFRPICRPISPRASHRPMPDIP